MSEEGQQLWQYFHEEYSVCINQPFRMKTRRRRPGYCETGPVQPHLAGGQAAGGVVQVRPGVVGAGRAAAGVAGPVQPAHRGRVARVSQAHVVRGAAN